MKKEKSLSLNSFMNTFKTFMGLVFPLITYPYALRVLGVDNIGKNNYANSIVSYFILLAGLGISRYAIREGARKRENRKEFSRFAGQMLAINIVSVTVAIADANNHIIGARCCFTPEKHILMSVYFRI